MKTKIIVILIMMIIGMSCGRKRSVKYGGYTRNYRYPVKKSAYIRSAEDSGAKYIFRQKRLKAVEHEKKGTEEYAKVKANKFYQTRKNPVSTFSIDVDTASYSNIRRFINQKRKPPKDAVRIEEMINYFTYNYTNPKGKHPFSVNVETSVCPWQKKNHLIHIGIQGKKSSMANLPTSNLVFLLDVSGSMYGRYKLPLLKKALKLLVKQLRARDRVAIVVYAGAAGLVLHSTPGNQKEKIIASINRLNAGGSTAGGAGIKLAYQIAQKNFIPKGINRVILATDGDFNVGVSSRQGLIDLMKKKREKGIYITVLGFGFGNYKDANMESIADKGNGNYYYIDTFKEAKKVLVSDVGGTLLTIAKDVKIQIQFNPEVVKAYRLIGYENRLMKKEDFNDDKKDAGELGAGHSVTALYEITLKKQTKQSEIITVKLRYKKPKHNQSRLIKFKVPKKINTLANASINFKFSAAVAAFGMLLRNSKFKGKTDLALILKLAKASKGKDKKHYRRAFIKMVKKYSSL